MKNYRIIQKKYIRDIKSEAAVYEHIKTGAKVVAMPCEDKNKAISIAFSTPSENDKGIAHIIEHSVLCGSKKYPLKDPFVQLMKGSMYSFLNAITFSDFTCYPVASTNEKDFKNLADVYLDAVFNPLLPNKKEIFLQEGKHYAIDEQSGEVTGFNGVVYNEMRGMQGNPEFHLEIAVSSSLFKNSPYAFESGGIPEAIADLSYAELQDFYKRHYNASNCNIFLYGNIDMDEMLGYIDSEYLSNYEMSERYTISELKAEDCVSEASANYPAAEEETEKGYYFSTSYALHIDHNPINMLTLRILDRILCSSQGALIKTEMQKRGIGEDFYAYIDELAKCPSVSFVSERCFEKDKEEFVSVIEKVLGDLVKNGIDKETLRSSLRMLEFQERESADSWTPKGISCALQMMPKFLYKEENPLELLEFFDAIDELKKLIETDYFEEFIKKHFLDNNHKTTVTLVPDSDYTAQQDKLLSDKCKEYADREDYDALCEDFRKLNEYRNSVDDRETSEKIPILERCDLSPTTSAKPSERISLGGHEMLFQNKNTNSIAYFDWLFDVRYLDSDLIDYYRIFTEIFGAMDTEKHSYAELSDLIDSYTGGITHTLMIADSTVSGGGVIPYMDWHTRALYENCDKAFELNREILLETDFSDTGHLYDMLLQLKTVTAHNMLTSSHVLAREIGLSAYSKQYAWKNRLKGYDFYKLLCSTIDNYDSVKDELVNKMNRIVKCIKNPNHWVFTYVGGEDFLDKAKKITLDFIALLDEENGNKAAEIELKPKSRQAFFTPSQVQYAGLCGELPECHNALRGNILVAQQLLSTEYLWQNIRVLGGAYGCSASFEYSGEGCMVSYRDPKLDNTIDCYKKSAEYLKSISYSEREIRQFVIGAINKLDQPKMAYLEGLVQISRELSDISTDEVNRIRKQIIDTDTRDINRLSDVLGKWIDGALETVIGNEQTIKASEIAFDSVKPLI